MTASALKQALKDVHFRKMKKDSAATGTVGVVKLCKKPRTIDDFDIAEKRDAGWFSQSGMRIKPYAWAPLVLAALRVAPVLPCCSEFCLMTLAL